MMLDYLGEKEASNSIIETIKKSLSKKENRTKDLEGMLTLLNPLTLFS